MVFATLIENTKLSAADQQPRLGTLTKLTTGWPLLCMVWMLSLILFAARLHEGYVSVDDPLLAHAAERTLNGEMPHIDFHDGYTGGLSYLHALALRLFGVRLLSLRLMLLLFFAAWVPTFWYISSRITSSRTASAITLLAVVWSVPIYASPVGSWYSLYFATFSIAALIRFLDIRSSRWIFLAGLSAGFSFLIKISGLYLLAGLGLFLVFDEQREPDSTILTRRTVHSSVYAVLITVAILAFDCVLVYFVHRHFNAPEFYNFLLPGYMLSAVLLVREWRKPPSTLPVRLSQLASRCLPLMLGFFTPVIAFLIPYAYTHNIGKFFTGVFILPMARLQFVYGPAIHPVGALSCVPIFVLMLLDIEMTNKVSRRITNGILTLLLCALLILSIRHASFAQWVWISAATTIPVIVGVGVVVLLRVESKTKEKSTLMLLLATVAMCSLIEFPYFAPMYFFYVAPLAIAAFTALYVQVKRHQFRSILLSLAAFYMGYAIFVIMPNQIYNQALSFKPVAQEAFTLSRASGLVGPKSAVEATEQAVTTLLAHAGGAPIYAGPDSPEFYFLTGLKNCTPNLVEFASGVDGEPSHILASIERSGVRAVLLNHTPGNDSGPLAPELETKLRNRFPESMTIGLLEVRWRQ